MPWFLANFTATRLYGQIFIEKHCKIAKNSEIIYTQSVWEIEI